jgi:hypothetical protein
MSISLSYNIYVCDIFPRIESRCVHKENGIKTNEIYLDLFILRSIFLDGGRAFRDVHFKRIGILIFLQKPRKTLIKNVCIRIYLKNEHFLSDHARKGVLSLVRCPI